MWTLLGEIKVELDWAVSKGCQFCLYNFIFLIKILGLKMTVMVVFVNFD